MSEVEPELMTLDEIAAFFRCSPAIFNRDIRPHLPPQRIGKRDLWYRPALRLYLARLYGLPSAVNDSQDALDAAFGSRRAARRVA